MPFDNIVAVLLVICAATVGAIVVATRAGRRRSLVSTLVESEARPVANEAAHARLPSQERQPETVHINSPVTATASNNAIQLATAGPLLWEQKNDPSDLPPINGIKGWRLNATLDIRTPLAWLRRDGEKLGPIPRTELPNVESDHAYWALIPKSSKDLRSELGLPSAPQAEPHDRARGSMLGPVAEDGGDLLPFLIGFRRIVEGDGSVVDRCRALKEYCERPEHRAIATNMKPTVTFDWAIDALNERLGIGTEMCARLFEADFEDVEKIRAASDAELLAVIGMGPKRLATVREALGRVIDVGSTGGSLQSARTVEVGLGTSVGVTHEQPFTGDSPLDQRAYAIQARGNADVVRAMEFVATLSRRTPLVALEHDGEQRPVDAELPSYGPPFAGVWVPVTRSLNEIMSNLGSKRRFREVDDRERTRATDLGPRSDDVSLFVAFLKEYRKIIECESATHDKLAQLAELWKCPLHAKILADVPSSWRTIWAIEAIDEALPICEELSRRIFEAGFLDLDAVRSATDDQLLQVDGIGPKRLDGIRRALGQS